MADNGTRPPPLHLSNLPAEWDTVTKIGYKAHQTRSTTVKSNAGINAAARQGTLQAEKKFTGTFAPDSSPEPPLSGVFDQRC